MYLNTKERLIFIWFVWLKDFVQIIIKCREKWLACAAIFILTDLLWGKVVKVLNVILEAYKQDRKYFFSFYKSINRSVQEFTNKKHK